MWPRSLSLCSWKFALYRCSCDQTPYQFFHEIVQSVAELLRFKYVQFGRLESFHLRCQRRILGIKWSDFITNAEVYTRSGLQSIQSIVRRRRLSLFGHVARMPDNIPAKAVLRVACDVRDGVPPFPNWHRSRGRPPITKLHQICSDCGLSAGDALNCAQDRAAWITYATASTALRWQRRRRRRIRGPSIWPEVDLTIPFRGPMTHSFRNRTSPFGHDRWKFLVSWAAALCVWMLKALTRNLLTYLLTYLHPLPDFSTVPAHAWMSPSPPHGSNFLTTLFTRHFPSVASSSYLSGLYGPIDLALSGVTLHLYHYTTTENGALSPVSSPGQGGRGFGSDPAPVLFRQNPTIRNWVLRWPISHELGSQN